MRALPLPVLLLLSSLAAAESPPPSIAGATASLERHDGFVPYYWDPHKGRLLLEVAPGAEMLYGVGLAGGAGTLEVSLDRGQLGALQLCRLVRVGPRVLLESRQTAHRSSVADRERTRVVEESFPTSILASFEVTAEDPGRLLVDATDFLLKDAEVLPALRQGRQGEWRQDAARSAFNFDRTGAFPRNTEIEAVLSFVSDAPPPGLAALLPDGRTLSLRVHHTFLKLPEPGFAPRPRDPRVGFFGVDYLDHTAPYTEPIERQLAARWRLEKKDPAAPASPPVKPLVYYLDRGMPEPERKAAREAALWWNHAFALAGLEGALVVEDLPEGASFLDARYSGIEWIDRADRGWSVGDSQVDPRTGEIVHGVARIDSHRRRTTSRVWQNLRAPEQACTAADSPDFAWLATGEPGLDEEGLVLARLRYLVAHEVGHTLGLDHNFAATTFGWGSVMDYLAPNVQLKAGAVDLSDAYPTDLGSYDRLAIQWGYTPNAEAPALDRLVREAYRRGVVYPLTSDARWAEYDWGADPVAWLRTTLDVRRVVLDRFSADTLAPGQPLYTLQQRFSLAYLYHRFGIQAAQQFVGGRFQTNALAGDGQVPLAWVPAARQKEALALLLEALRPANLDVPDRALAVLVPPPSLTSPSREQFASDAGAAFDPLTAARVLAGLVVHPLLDPERAERLTIDPDPDALTFADVLDRLVAATWDAPAEPTRRRASLQRVGQRVVLDALLDLAARSEVAPGVRATAVARLLRLRADLRARVSADPATQAHLALAARDVAEFLDHPEVRKARPRPPVPPGRPIGN